MDWLESGKMAVKTLTANKLRTSLTMLGMIIGNASVIAMIGIGQSAQKLAADQFESLGPNVLFVSPGSSQARQRTTNLPRTLVWDDAKAIASQVPSVKEVAAQRQTQLPLIYGGRNRNSLITGTTPEFLSVRDFDIAKGRFLTNLDLERNNRVAVLGSQIATDFFGGKDPIGQQIRIRNVSFEVIGIMQAKGSFLGSNQDDAVYVPLTTTASVLTGRTSPYGLDVSIISVSAKNEASVPAAEFQITNLLRLRHKIISEDDFTVQTQKDILRIVGTITGGLTAMLAAIAGVSLLVGGIGIMNIMLVSVSERTQEIGLRKAIGAAESDILIQFMIEAVLLSAAGGVIGTAVGVGGILLVGVFSPLSASVSPVAIALAVSVSGSIGLIFGVIPARQAAKLDPIVALRSA
ncbi:ABC transporter permease [Phormidesmis priestleyi ULC007]|uniref:ABC transporter permease n=2 Tax=Phormidesmis priestleyi TaxID=268141 RepID=A0A2T1DP82_9CYAN|nr:ABC transporter permease [Phormidesmis priestleyi]PSB22255.1 ABC transporter permease [Phormidesmis priestleyi ULC007]PZO55123.1 MAG: ABC transporter permease [Phormidesmis priestleyi]